MSVSSQASFFQEETPLLFDVSSALMPFEAGSHGQIAAWLRLPACVNEREPLWLLLCIPGIASTGHMAFHRQGPDETGTLIQGLTHAGLGVLVIDTLGTGASSCSLEGNHITTDVTSAVLALVLALARRRISRVLSCAPRQIRLAALGMDLGAIQLIDLALVLQERGTPLETLLVTDWIDQHDRWEVAGPSRLVDSAERGYLQLHPAHLHAGSSTSQDAPSEAGTLVPEGLWTDLVTPGIAQAQAALLRCPILHLLSAQDLRAASSQDVDPFAAAWLKAQATLPGAEHDLREPSAQVIAALIAGWMRLVRDLHRVLKEEPHP